MICVGLLAIVNIATLLLLSGCPAPEEPVVPSPAPAYPPDYQQDVEDALKSSTPDETKFPFDPEGTNCPDDQQGVSSDDPASK